MHLLTLDTLKNLDFGKVSKAFSRELKHCVLDCMDRPNDDGARVVNLTLTLKPVTSGQECEACTGEFEVKSKVPVRRSRTFSLGVKNTGALYFNEDSPDAVDQTTLFDPLDDKGHPKRDPPEEQ